MKKLTLTPPAKKRPIDPLEIFQATTLRGDIENIWEPQAEALKEWHSSHRKATDVVLQMNTGGGKTLVGLLMAQSLVNETNGRVLYVCPNKQLVEQTQKRADEIGLSPAIRFGGAWTNEAEYQTGATFCITNYHTIFNGRSIFLNDSIDAVVFDDAHVAEGTIRSCFTVVVPRDHAAFSPLLTILRPHFATSSRATQFQQIAEGSFTPVLFVPTYVIWREYESIRKKLIEHEVGERKETKFSWDHIKEHLAHCCILLTSAAIEITPLSVPLSGLPYFGKDVRRVYLTATLPSQTAFVRTFGVDSPTVVKPSGKSGDAQRLFVFVSGKDDDAQREAAKALVTDRKCCVISPSKKKAEQWVPPSQIYDTDSGQAEIDRFRNSKAPEMLGLVARYDGIDLPGKSCKVLILDRLPKGEHLIDQFIDEGIKVETIRQSHRATRIVQAIGRIFRSNTDHGIVILVGTELQAWLRHQKHLGYLPPLLQQQLKLGGELAKAIEKKETTWPELMEAVLTGHENWDATYKDYISEFETTDVKADAEWHLDLIKLERRAYEELWGGQPGKAADLYGQMARTAASHDHMLAAWYRHLRGLALLCANDRPHALYEYLQAANVRSELGRPSEDIDKAFKPKTATVIGPQAKALATWYGKKKVGMIAAFATVENDLIYGDETAKAEEATKILGTLLGLNAERPDNEKKVGPDVVWKEGDATTAWGFELKTDKKVGSEYNKKDDIGQCHNHEEWMRKAHGDRIELAILGRMLPVSKKADPSPLLRVIDLEAMRELRDRAKKVFDSVESGDKSDIAQSFQTWLNHYGLNSPQCVESLPSQLATDLRDKD